MQLYDLKKSIEELQDEGFTPKTLRRMVWVIIFSTLICLNVAGIILISLTCKLISLLLGYVPLSQISFNTGILFTINSFYIIPKLVRGVHSILPEDE
jgi:hypothetical protein